MNLFLGWFDTGQNILDDTFLILDNICMLMVMTIGSTHSAGGVVKDVLSLQVVFLMADVFLFINFARAFYINRANNAIYHTLWYCVAWFSPGFMYRMICLVVVQIYGDESPIGEWDWIWCCLVDVLAIFMNNVYKYVKYKLLEYPSHTDYLPQDILFLDARFNRLFTIAVALLMTSSARVSWDNMDWGCRIGGVFRSACWVFVLLPLFITFDREPGTLKEHHAMRRSSWTGHTHVFLVIILVGLVACLSGTIQAYSLKTCGNQRQQQQYAKLSADSLLCWLSSLILVGSVLRAYTHNRPKTHDICPSTLNAEVYVTKGLARPCVSRNMRMAARLVAAFSIKLVNWLPIAESDGTVWVCVIIINAVLMIYERQGRVPDTVNALDWTKRTTEEEFDFRCAEYKQEMGEKTEASNLEAVPSGHHAHVHGQRDLDNNDHDHKL